MWHRESGDVRRQAGRCDSSVWRASSEPAAGASALSGHVGLRWCRKGLLSAEAWTSCQTPSPITGGSVLLLLWMTSAGRASPWSQTLHSRGGVSRGNWQRSWRDAGSPERLSAKMGRNRPVWQCSGCASRYGLTGATSRRASRCRTPLSSHSTPASGTSF